MQVTNDSGNGVEFSSDKEGSRQKVIKYIYTEDKDDKDSLKEDKDRSEGKGCLKALDKQGININQRR